jgi:NADH-quinone oxidoreductase subunit N
MIGLTVLAGINSAVAAYYYLRILVAMYMSVPVREIPREPVPGAVQWVLGVCAAGTLLLGVVPQPVLNFAMRASQWFQGQ